MPAPVSYSLVTRKDSPVNESLPLDERQGDSEVTYTNSCVEDDDSEGTRREHRQSCPALYQPGTDFVAVRVSLLLLLCSLILLSLGGLALVYHRGLPPFVAADAPPPSWAVQRCTTPSPSSSHLSTSGWSAVDASWFSGSDSLVYSYFSCTQLELALVLGVGGE